MDRHSPDMLLWGKTLGILTDILTETSPRDSRLADQFAGPEPAPDLIRGPGTSLAGLGGCGILAEMAGDGRVLGI